MKITQLAFYEVYPPASGAASVSFNFISHLDGSRVIVQCTPEPGFNGLSDGVEIKSIVIGRQYGWRRALRILSSMNKILNELMSSSPEVVILEGASWAIYFAALIFLMKIKNKRRRLLLVYHAHNVEYIIRLIRGTRLLGFVTRKSEAFVLKQSDVSTACSEVDAGQFEKFYGVKPLILPNGVALSQFENLNSEVMSKIKNKYNLRSPLVLFIGLPSYPPNAEAISFLVEKVFPLILKKKPAANLAIAGGDIPFSRPWLISPGLISSSEIPAFLKAADVCVAPIFAGSGTRVKILEYLAAGRPVVSTRKGVEGLEVKEGKNVMLAETADEIADKVVRLIEDHELALALGEAGQRLVAEKYNWKNLAADFQARLETVLLKKIN